jgi:hypothetical protein
MHRNTAYRAAKETDASGERLIPENARNGNRAVAQIGN